MRWKRSTSPWRTLFRPGVLWPGIVVGLWGSCAQKVQASLTSTVPGYGSARHALLIGVNHGLAHEAPLRYAESDVDRMAEVLESVGGFAPEHIIRLKNVTADRVREVLVDLNLALQAKLRAGGEAILFVYYSGHGSSGLLHLQNTTLKTDELAKLVRLSPARLKLLLLDACRAGTLTRVKGGRPVAPFQIGLSDALVHEGYAVITSSAAGEDAQESDVLRSSIFTHHFIAALRGLGDGNGDRLVTLGEAYAYAYAESLRTSMATLAGSQHATFDYDLRGRTDPVLSDLRRTESLGVLVLASPGEYLLEPLSSGGPLFEAHVRRARTPIALTPATYRVRRRMPNAIAEIEVRVDSGQSRVLDAGTMTQLPLAQVVRKGEVAARLATGPSLSGFTHGPIADGFSPAIGLQLGWAVELKDVSLVPRLWMGQSQSRHLEKNSNVASHQLSALALEIAVQHVFDVGPVALAPQLSLGAMRLTQAVALRAGASIEQHPIALVSAVGGALGYALGHGLSLETNVELATFYLPRRTSTESGAPTLRAGTVTYRVGLGIGYRY